MIIQIVSIGNGSSMIIISSNNLRVIVTYSFGRMLNPIEC